LPALIPTINGGEIFENAHDLDLVSGHTAYHRASLIDLYLQAKFHWNRRNFFVDGRM